MWWTALLFDGPTAAAATVQLSFSSISLPSPADSGGKKHGKAESGDQHQKYRTFSDELESRINSLVADAPGM